MNWFSRLTIAQSKPMALPSVAVVPDNHERDKHYGIDRIDIEMTEETAQELERQYPGITYLGAGQHGIAYECEPGISCKISNNSWEAGLASRFLKHPCDG